MRALVSVCMCMRACVCVLQLPMSGWTDGVFNSYDFIKYIYIHSRNSKNSNLEVD